MSHFSVLVVVNEPASDEALAAALQPFHEFECTGTDDRFVTEVDDSESELDPLLARIKEDEGKTPLEDIVDGWTGYRVLHGTGPRPETSEYKYGFVRVVDGVATQIVRRTNPNRKWDYWRVGGRWDNNLMLRVGGRADHANAADVAWDSMIAEKTAEAVGIFDRVTAAIAGRPVTVWSDFLARTQTGELSVGDARLQYHSQEAVKAVASIDDFSWSTSEYVDEVVRAESRAAYAEAKAASWALTYAILIDGEWHEPGRMGWFGMSSKTDDSEKAYTAKFWDIVRGLDKSKHVYVVNCHI